MLLVNFVLVFFWLHGEADEKGALHKYLITLHLSWISRPWKQRDQQLFQFGHIFQQIKEVFHGVIDQGNKLSSISENNPQYEKFRL